MLNLKIDDGVQEINLNGKVTVMLNLTDTNFIERFFNAFEDMDSQQEEYRNRINQAENKEIFSIAKEMNEVMKDKIDAAFGQPICDDLFGDISLYAIAGGLPIWCNLMLAIVDEIDSTNKSQKKLTNPRIQKYISKYKSK